MKKIACILGMLFISLSLFGQVPVDMTVDTIVDQSIQRTDSTTKSLRFKGKTNYSRVSNTDGVYVLNKKPYRYIDTIPPRKTYITDGISCPPSQVYLGFFQGRDNIGVTGYRVYRKHSVTGNVVELGDTPDLEYHDNNGLESGVTYLYSVAAFDKRGNLSPLSDEFEITTLSTSSVPIAAFNLLQVTPLDGKSAVVNINANTQVLVSITDSNNPAKVYYDNSTHDPLPYKPNHTITIEGLKELTYYAWDITIMNSLSRPTTKKVEFQTLSDDNTAPVFDVPPLASAISDVATRITYMTDEFTNTVIKYGIKSVEEETFKVKKFDRYFDVTLNGLQRNTNYQYQVIIDDLNNNGPIASSIHYFTTAKVADTTKPTYGTTTVHRSSNDMLTIAATTNEPTTAIIEYWPAGVRAEKKIIYDNTFRRYHAMTLSGLEQMGYNYTTKFTDAFGNTRVCDHLDAVRPALEPDTTAPKLAQMPNGNPYRVLLSDTSMTLYWKTDEIANAEVLFTHDLNQGIRTAYDTKTAEMHKVRLTNLLPGKTYHIQVRSTDPAGNTMYIPNKTSGIQLKTRPAGSVTPLKIIRYTGDINAEFVSIYWETNKPAFSGFYYRHESESAWTEMENYDDLTAKAKTTHSAILPRVNMQSGRYYIKFANVDTEDQYVEKATFDNGTALQFSLGMREAGF